MGGVQPVPHIPIVGDLAELQAELVFIEVACCGHVRVVQRDHAFGGLQWDVGLGHSGCPGFDDLHVEPKCDVFRARSQTESLSPLR